MKLRILLLLLGIFTLIRSYAQTTSDSLTCLKPNEIDFFLSQNVKANNYFERLTNCESDNKNLLNGIKEKDFVIAKKDDLLNFCQEDNQMNREIIKGLDARLKRSERKIVGLKIGCVAIGIVGIAGTTYFIFH